MSRIRYACPFCNRTYDTQEEAEACAKWPEKHWKPGDLVQDENGGAVYRIDALDPGRYAAHVTRVFDVEIARFGRAYMSRADKEFGGRYYLVGGFWCRAKRFTTEDARKLLKETERTCKAKLEAAKRVLNAALAAEEAQNQAVVNAA